MIRNFLLFSIIAFALGACGGRPDEKVDDFFAEKEYIAAAQWLDKQLTEDEDAPLLHGLAAEAKTHMCIQTSCTTKKPALLKEISRHLSYVKEEVTTGEGGKRDIYANLLGISKGFTGKDNYPGNLIAFTAALPATPLKKPFIEQLFQMSFTHLNKMEVPAALTFLTGIEENSPKKSAEAGYAMVLRGLAAQDEALIETGKDILKESKKALLPSAASVFPYTLFFHHAEKDSTNGALVFAINFKKSLTKLNIPQFLTIEAQKIMAGTLAQMAQNNAFLDFAQEHVAPLGILEEDTSLELQDEQRTPSDITTNTPENITTTTEITAASQTVENTPVVSKAPESISPVVGITEAPQEEVTALLTPADKKEIFRLHLLKTSLVLHPDQTDVWQKFLQPAMAYVDRTGNVDLLFSDIDSKKIPANAIEPYNKRLFSLIEKKVKKKENILSLLEKAIIPKQAAEKTRQKILTLLKEALLQAIDTKDYDQIVDYASFKPELAKPQRQQIVKIVIAQIEKLWEENTFKDISRLGKFLSGPMEIDFNIDNLLLQSFDEYLDEIKIADTLSASTPEKLLKKQDEVRVDLGPKFKYLTQHFSKNPDIVDAQLKTLVVNAKDAYGTPSAFFQLFHLFNNEKFPIKERNEFLVGAIKDSLSKDKEISAEEVAKTGYQLIKHHPDIPLIFIIGETLKRISSLEEARDIWASVNDEFRENLRNVRPQFTTLMEAIDAYEADRKQRSADLFSILSDEKYLTHAQPYLEKFQKMVTDHTGVFISRETDEKMNVVMLFIEPGERQETILDRLEVNVTLVNAVGSIMVKANQELIEDYGQTFRYTLKNRLDPDSREIKITEELRAEATLPQSFERTFGEITALKFEEDGTIVIRVASGKIYRFTKIAENGDKPIFPIGTYGITKQFSVKNSNTDHVMPIGTILEINIDKKRPLQPVKDGKRLSIIYPITGTIKHPSAEDPRPLTGYYSLHTHTVNLNYDYPFGRGRGTLDAVVKCHILDTHVICAGHNKHWSRLRYSHIVGGKKAAGSGEGTLQNNDTPDAPVEEIVTPEEIPAEDTDTP